MLLARQRRGNAVAPTSIFRVISISAHFVPHSLFPPFFPVPLSGHLSPAAVPLPPFPAVPTLTGNPMELRSHTAGCVHTDVSLLVLFCPAPVTWPSTVYLMSPHGSLLPVLS